MCFAYSRLCSYKTCEMACRGRGPYRPLPGAERKKRQMRAETSRHRAGLCGCPAPGRVLWGVVGLAAGGSGAGLGCAFGARRLDALPFSRCPAIRRQCRPWREGAQGQIDAFGFSCERLKGAVRCGAGVRCQNGADAVLSDLLYPAGSGRPPPSAWITASRNRLPMAECSEDGGCAPAQSGPASPAGQNGWKRLKSPARGQGFLFCTFLEEGGHIFYGHHGKADHSCRQRQI